MPPIVSSSSTPSLGDVRLAAVDSSLPADGQVLSGLKVVERSDASAPGGVARGVLLEGKFYPVELPDDVHEGDRINVKAALNGAGAVQLTFVERTPQETTAKPSRATSTLLESLLKTFDLNQQTVETLKQALLPLVSRGAGDKSAVEIPPFLRQLLKSADVPELKDLENSSVVSSRLTSSTDETIARLIRSAVDKRVFTMQTAAGGRAAELMRLVIRELEVTGSKTAVLRGNENAKGIPSNARPALESEKLTQLLKTIAPHFEAIVDRSTQGQGERLESRDAALRAFKELLGAQLEAVKTFESRVRVLLGESTAADPISRLLVALKDLENSVKDDTTPLGKQIYSFVKEFSTEIARALTHPENSSALRQVLEEGLRTLYQTFGLTPLFERFASVGGGDWNQELPHALKGSLRLIETQLVTLLSDPDFDQKITELFKNKSDAFAVKLQELYRDLDRTLQQLPDESRSPRFAKVTETLEEAKRLLARLFAPEEGGERPSPEQVKATLQALHVAVFTAQEFEDQPDIVPGLPVRNPSDTVQRIVKNIERLLIDLLPQGEAPDGASADAISDLQKQVLGGFSPVRKDGANPERNSPQTSQRFDLQNLKALLKQLAIELPASGDPMENDLLDTTFQFIDQLETFERTGEQRFPALKDATQRALNLFRGHLERLEPGSLEHQPLSLIDTDTLNRVNQMVSSQETLLRMIPVIKALGEPVLMLFPFMIGGFLSRGQISFSPPGREENKSFSHGESGSSDVFSRVKVLFPLPALGDVLVDAAFRPGEMLLNIGLKSRAAATFLEERAVGLRQILLALGYSKTQIFIVEMNQVANRSGFSANSTLESLWDTSHTVG